MAAILVAVPAGVVTVTVFAPVVPEGAVAVIDVALFTARLVAAAPPTVTLVAPVRLVPVMVILVPPSVDPEVGETAVMVGAGR